MECVLYGKPEHTILRLHEKAEIAALLKHGLRAHLITNTMYEIDKDLFLDAHRQAVETEMNFITELKTKLFLKSPIEYLLILFPFYCDDLMRQHGGLSIVDRTKILIGLEKFDDDKFLTAIKEYQMLGMSYSHTSAEILTKLKDVLAKKKATGSIWAIPDKSA